MRRTKIIATLGPATDSPEMMEKLFHAGLDIVRLNYSHQGHAEHEMRLDMVREMSNKFQHAVGVVADLQGPKIRIEKFRNDKIFLNEGDPFTLDIDYSIEDGDETRVAVSYKDLPKDVRVGDTLLLDDGKMSLIAKEVNDHEIICEASTSGVLSNRKGLNLKGGGLSASSLTEKDIEDLKHAVKIGADFIAISFVRTADDIHQARKLIEEAGGNCGIIAKIERSEALNDIEPIIEAADVIMIARGDLGVEIGDASLPPVQKQLIKTAREMDRGTITATQMMETMISETVPTRAEVFDVANAVLDGTDAVMLSAETSVGKHPHKVVEAMARICEETEKQRLARVSDHRINQRFESIPEAIAMSTMYAANHIGAKAIAALTESGQTCVWMSRISSGIPIFAFSRHENSRRKSTLYRGVYPVNFDITHSDPLAVNKEIIEILMEKKVVQEGDVVLITKGDLRGTRGKTNNMKIIRVGEAIEHTI